MMRSLLLWLSLFVMLLAPGKTVAFGIPAAAPTGPRQGLVKASSCRTPSFLLSAQQPQEQTVFLQIGMDDEKVRSLFAWISRAFDGDERYNNLMLAIAAIFGNLPQDSKPVQMARDALDSLPEDESALTGQPFSLYERESASLGAMGAAQWTGQWRTRPHALLSLRNMTSVEDWERTLPRGCRRTLKRSLEQNFTVTARPIRQDKPAPHSSLAHFRCVVEHEVRLLTYSPDTFFDALAEAVSRYMGTTRMTGEIREYRCQETGRVLAFAHEVRKGRTIRGQWFYSTDEGSKRYIWFHSVRSLVERAFATETVDTVDLGPSGSDEFSELKARYGFQSFDDWPHVADYMGPFWNYEKEEPQRNGVEW